MRVLVLGGFLMLAGCGGGSTTGTNYSDPPPQATIVATPTPTPSPTGKSTTVETTADTDAENSAGE